MKKETHYSVILVPSTSHALYIEKTLKKSDLACRLVPVPRILSSDCGVCVRINRIDKDAVLEALSAARAEFDCIHDT
jgi:hypothetical protein